MRKLTRIPLGWKLSRSHRRRPGTDVNDWFGATAGEKAPAALLLTRLAKLKHIIDSMVARKEGGRSVPGMRKEDDE